MLDEKLTRAEAVAESIEERAWCAYLRFLAAHQQNRAARQELREYGYRRDQDGPI